MSNRIEFNAIPALPYTHQGITYDEPSSHHYKANGTPSGVSLLRFHNAYSLPAWFQWGQSYNLHMQKSGNTDKVQFQIQYEDTNGNWYTPVRTTSDLTFSIPQPATFRQMGVSLRVPSGAGLVDESVYPYLIEQPAYQPRLSAQGIRYDYKWYSRNPYYLASNPNPPPPNFGLPNCTCYAWGRFWEIAGGSAVLPNGPALSTGNAEDWFGHTADGYTRGYKPELGAICCYADGDFSGLGHVCVVEEIYPDGSFLVSESAWQDYFFRASHVIAANCDYGYGNYVFQGFIYNPYAGDTDTPPYIEGSNFHLILAKRVFYRKRGLYIP